MLKLAVTTTVKNDYYFIEDFINYYKKIGFHKIIIFDDGSSKKFLKIISKYNFVSVIEKNTSYQLKDTDWLKEIRSQYHFSFDIRKRFNTYYACKLLYKDGFDWLLSCDTDEFIGSFRDGQSFNLKEKLKNLKVPQASFLARDVVFNTKKKLFENTKFRSLGVCDYWFGKFYQILLTKFNSNILDKSYSVIFNSIFGKKITKINIGETYFIIPVNPSYLGHKSILNLKYYRNKNFNVHYWVNSENHKKLSYKVIGALYHFDLTCAKQVFDKFRKRTDKVAFNGPNYRNFLESKAKSMSFKEFNVFYNNYIYAYNNVETIEIKQIMSLLKNE
ncbi:MAG: hypothetical protein CL851_04045 [Crocinitomicaceae bacterium]|nr:hypothetical protein [Crocinitomicaceae bacterium]